MRRQFCLIALAVVASALGAQRRPMSVAPPPSRTISTLTTTDSLGLAAAGARAALGDGKSSVRCVTGVAASLPGPVGEGFLKHAGEHVLTLPAAAPGSPTQYVFLAGFRDGDTSTVRLTVSGSNRTNMWSNDIEYLFVRDGAAGGWRAVGTVLAGATDYNLTDSTRRTTPKCLNGSRQ